MPWRIEQRDGKHCVVKESDGEVEGCHEMRTDALRQMKALYAHESRVASMYADLDAQADPEPVEAQPEETQASSELVKIEIGTSNEALTASVLQQMERMSERQAQTDQALIAALSAIGMREPVVNVAAPTIEVAAPEVNVEPPAVTVEAPAVTVQAPNVTVQHDIVMPEPAPSHRHITLERNLDGRIVGADIKEE